MDVVLFEDCFEAAQKVWQELAKIPILVGFPKE